jgi:hypothetical protein
VLRLQQAHEPSIAPSRNRSPIGTYSTQPRFILESTFIEPGDRNETGVIIAATADYFSSPRTAGQGLPRRDRGDRETRRGRPVRIVLGDPMPERVKLLPEPGDFARDPVLQCCGGGDGSSPSQHRGVAPLQYFGGDDHVHSRRGLTSAPSCRCSCKPTMPGSCPKADRFPPLPERLAVTGDHTRR